jgi:hypothetical protein
MRLFFLMIPKPPSPLVPYVAGGSDSIRLKKKTVYSAIFMDLEEKFPDPQDTLKLDLSIVFV